MFKIVVIQFFAEYYCPGYDFSCLLFVLVVDLCQVGTDARLSSAHVPICRDLQLLDNRAVSLPRCRA